MWLGASGIYDQVGLHDWNPFLLTGYEVYDIFCRPLRHFLMHLHYFQY
jgi:hypothetical protein